VRSMMREEPEARPTAEKVQEEVAMIGGLASAIGRFAFCNPCCNDMADTNTMSRSHLRYQDMSIIIGNTYALKEPNIHTYTFFITVSNPSIVEKVHVYLVRTPCAFKIVKLTKW
jgi:hypothetical protein